MTHSFIITLEQHVFTNSGQSKLMTSERLRCLLFLKASTLQHTINKLSLLGDFLTDTLFLLNEELDYSFQSEVEWKFLQF